jgi:hypothetical protein
MVRPTGSALCPPFLIYRAATSKDGPLMPIIRYVLPLTLLVSSLANALPAAATAQEAHAVSPGYWSYTASTILPGASTGNQCVRPDQIDEFMSGPHNRHYRCTYPSRSVGSGRASFEGVCVSKHGNSYNLKVSGHYSQTTFNLKGHISGIVILGLPISAPISIEAKWLGPTCPPGAK